MILFFKLGISGSLSLPLGHVVHDLNFQLPALFPHIKRALSQSTDGSDPQIILFKGWVHCFDIILGPNKIP